MELEVARPRRVVYHADALEWLESCGSLEGTSVVTSLPDFSEFSWPLAQWKTWFRAAVAKVLIKTPDDGVAVFFQTDIKVEGTWVDKSFLCMSAAEQTGHTLLWHKLVARVPAGTPTFGRPGYSHLIAFSRNVRVDISKSSADILPVAGETTWTRGMGTKACETACEFVQTHTRSHTILDPFCGHGTVLAVSNALGFHAIGVELGGKRARKAGKLIFDIKLSLLQNA